VSVANARGAKRRKIALAVLDNNISECAMASIGGRWK